MERLSPLLSSDSLLSPSAWPQMVGRRVCAWGAGVAGAGTGALDSRAPSCGGEVPAVSLLSAWGGWGVRVAGGGCREGARLASRGGGEGKASLCCGISGTPLVDAGIPTSSFFPLFPVKLLIFLGVRAHLAALNGNGFSSLFPESEF